MNPEPFGGSFNESDCSSPKCSCGSNLARRDFLKWTGLSAAALASAGLRAVAGPFNPSDFEKLVPADKKLSPEWVKSLFARGTREIYRGAELEKIGMPVGGICAGQLYLGGDGKLWHWDIFNKVAGTGDGHYAKPPLPSSPLEQGFAIMIWNHSYHRLDRTGWSEVTFNGEYPFGFVEYRDPAVPVSVTLEAFSPFIPLNVEDSALPATILRFTVKNISQKRVEADLAGWLENGVCLYSGKSCAGLRRNRIVRRENMTFLECLAEKPPSSQWNPPRPAISFDDFEEDTYEGWSVTGDAFGRGPAGKEKIPSYQGDLGMHGKRAVNSHATAPGQSVTEKDSATGTLLSKPFRIERNYITFLIGGGGHKDRTCLNVLVDGKVVASATGRNENRMQPQSLDVRPWFGHEARLQIVDNEKGPWGNIGVDEIIFSDAPRGASLELTEQPDFGTMGLALLADKSSKSQDFGCAGPIPESNDWAKMVLATSGGDQTGPLPFEKKAVSSLTRKFALEPGQSTTITFVLTWHFPNIQLGGLGKYEGRWYGKKFSSALAVAEYVAGNFERLSSQTRLWHDTWYDSTLPYWFLDRAFLNTSILATNTCYWFGNGRFYAWEGVGCCAGTCTHVWHYAHAPARLFPQLERALREMTDFGVGFEETGRIRFRAEHNNHWAVDGQAGCILRTYREHQMSADDKFLRRVWPRAKKALQFLISKDANADGIIDGPQHNTLDADWFGQVAWLSSLYLAALRAGEEMAKEMGDESFARQCREIFEKGRRGLDEKLFNGEYYVQTTDEAHRKAVGSYDGCEIDQVFGQSWACQVGLGRILDQAHTRTALQSLWKYNFTPDVGPYRQAYKPGRWYAMAGEGGLLMCTWPKGEAERVKENYDFYFNECMTGFEYQVAWHMIAEGMVMEGLAVARMIHDRYHPSRRNPWNEVECGDHYARAMASYGVYLAACGYEYHGPKGYLAFAPKLTPENFKCAFTTAEGWGSYIQTLEGRSANCEIALRWGQLHLRTLALGAIGILRPTQIKASLAGKAVPATLIFQNGRAEIKFGQEINLSAGDVLKISLTA